MSLRESASGGDRVAALRDLRDLLAGQIERCESLRDLAALSGRLQSVLEEIDGLAPPESKGDAVDEIAERRSARRSGTRARQARPKRSG